MTQIFTRGLMLKVSHPLVLSLFIIGLSFMVALQIRLLTVSWVFFALILIFLGGIIVIFLYFSSLLNLEKVFRIKVWGYIRVGIVVAGVVRVIDEGFSGVEPEAAGKEVLEMNFELIYFPANILLLFYLLFTLVVVVKISECFKGALDSRL